MKTILTERLLRVLTLSLICCCFIGCADRFEEYELTHYATGYVVSRDFQLHSSGIKEGFFSINFLNSKHLVTFASKDKDLETYNNLTKKYNDNSYRERLLLWAAQYDLDRLYFDDAIKRIEITCDQDVDENHPQGTPLNDLFLFYTRSPDEFLEGGSKLITNNGQEEFSNIDPRFEDFIHLSYAQHLYGKMSEIEFSKYKLIGGIELAGLGYFAWITPPQNITDYTLTLTIEFVDGVKNSASMTISK